MTDIELSRPPTKAQCQVTIVNSLGLYFNRETESYGCKRFKFFAGMHQSFPYYLSPEKEISFKNENAIISCH